VHGAFRDFAPEAAKNIKGRVLILHGAEDPVAPMDEVNAVISQFRAARWTSRSTSIAVPPWVYEAAEPSEARADDEYKVAMTRFLKDLLAH